MCQVLLTKSVFVKFRKVSGVGLNFNPACEIFVESAVFVDLNENPQITDNARCLHTRMDLGVTNGTHKGERSGVLEEGPRAILNPFKETIRQNGRRIK